MVDPQKVRHLLALYRRYRAYLSDLADRLMAMARFRNVLVHLYAEVDEERVLQILRGPVNDLDAFVASLRKRFSEEIDG